MSTDMRPLLDRLDAAQEEWSTNGLDVDTTDGEVWNTLFRRPRWMDADDVRSLVELHNALPRLLAAVRAAADLADELDGFGQRNADRAQTFHDAGERDDYHYRAGRSDSYLNAAERLRKALTAALTEGDQS